MSSVDELLEKCEETRGQVKSTMVVYKIHTFSQAELKRGNPDKSTMALAKGITNYMKITSNVLRNF